MSSPEFHHNKRPSAVPEKRQLDLLSLLITLVILFLASTCGATVYECVDENGQKTFQNYPCLQTIQTTEVEPQRDPGQNTQQQPASQQEAEALQNENKEISGSFQASYYDRRKGNAPVYSEKVDTPAINYEYDTFHDISAERLSAHWEGTLDFPEDMQKNINIFEAFGKTELFIDGVNVWTSTEQYAYSLSHFFPAGKHKIEARFENSYFSASFLLTLTDSDKTLTDRELSEKLAGLGDYDTIYCGTFESGRPDKTIDLSIDEHPKSLVLFLSSNEPNIWDFGAAQNLGDVKAVIISSQHFGAVVRNLPPRIPVYYGQIPYATSYNPQTTNSGEQSFKDIALQIQAISGRKPVGFSGRYDMSQTSLPELILDEKRYGEIGL